MKSFYSGIDIREELLAENQKNDPIRLEYYRIKNEETKESKCYGIEVVKIEYKDEKPRVERKTIENLTEDESTLNQFLDTLRRGYVTPVTAPYVVEDYFGKF